MIRRIKPGKSISGPRQQKGVALITAILMVALATMLAAKLAWDNHVSLRRTETTLAIEQARLIALGAESIAVWALREDDNLDADYWDPVNQEEFWARELAFEVGIDELAIGTMQGQLVDATSKLNVNNLVQPNGVVDPVTKDQFTRLMDKLGLDPRLIDNFVDWIDGDTVSFQSGAEDGSYTALETPYRPANNYFISPSEIWAVYDMDEDTYELLQNYITALPAGWCGSSFANPTSINLNFASAAVIESLDDDISPGDVEAWIEQQSESPFESLADFGPGLPDAVKNGGYVAVNSRCFELRVLVTIGSSVLSMYSLLERTGSNDEIIIRVRSYGLDLD